MSNSEHGESSGDWGEFLFPSVELSEPMPLTPEQFLEHLESARGENFAAVSEVASELQCQFDGSIAGTLIRGSFLPRKESQALLDAIDEGKDVVVHGAAGSGKSALVHNAITRLSADEYLVLPIRLDRRSLESTAARFGAQIGLDNSPPRWLTQYAAGRKAVLLLDQLDAIRWTAHHSGEALDVCTQMLREVRALRRAGVAISCILVCRSFDLEHDPEISRALSDTPENTLVRVRVADLDDPLVAGVLGAGAWASCSLRQKRILRVPQNLAILVQMGSDAGSGFSSATNLMRRFWADRRLALDRMGIAPGDLQSYLHSILNFCEQKSVISIPVSLALAAPRTLAALKSLSILQEDGARVSFCHQSYLDFLLAERLFHSVLQTGNSLEVWIGSRDHQSLFRREQLRQVLTMLAEESPRDFSVVAPDLLSNNGVRFHMKHLVLEVLGDVSAVAGHVGKMVVDLLHQDRWCNHIGEVVFYGHLPWLRYLHQNGSIQLWLDSTDEATRSEGYRLVRSIAEDGPDLMCDILVPRVGASAEQDALIMGCLPNRMSVFSSTVVELRISLARGGTIAEFVDWEYLARNDAALTLRLVSEVAKTLPLTQEALLKVVKKRSYAWNTHELAVLLTAVEKEPLLAWTELFPSVEARLPHGDELDYDHRQLWLREWEPNGAKIGACRGLVELCKRAARLLAAETPGEFLELTTALRGDTRDAVVEILFEGFTSLPASHADIGPLWILERPKLLEWGSKPTATRWEPAAELIRATSPHCSPTVFDKLQDTLIKVHSTRELANARRALRRSHKGTFQHYWGHAQHHLLPALCARRRSKQVNELIGVLARKFQSHSAQDFLNGPIFHGGYVGSPLPANSAKLSNAQWLAIISNPEIPQDDGKWRGVTEAGFAETSVVQMARSFQTAAEHEPQRFAELGRQLPLDADVRYHTSLLHALRLSKPERNWSEDLKSRWKPTSIGATEAVLIPLARLDDKELASAYCRVIGYRASEDWSEAVLEGLSSYAAHPDPLAGSLNVYNTAVGSSEDAADVADLERNALNCVRGAAARSIGAVLWKHPTWLAFFLPTIEQLVTDAHSAVRLAAIESLTPVLNVDKDLAVALFKQAVSNDLRVAAGRESLHFMRYCQSSHPSNIEPIVSEMVRSERIDVARAGAAMVAFSWIHYGRMNDELELCISHAGIHTEAVAEVIRGGISVEKIRERCRSLCLRLIHSKSHEAVRVLAHIVDDEGLLDSKDGLDFLRQVLLSGAYSRDTETLGRGLHRLGRGLLPVSDIVFGVYDQLIGAGRGDSGFRYLGISDFLSVLLRLYEAAELVSENDIVSRCLDIWDSLFEKRIGYAPTISRAIQE